MVQICIEPFVSVRAIREFLSKVFPERKFIDRHMINNVRTHARQRNRETSFIETYQDTSNNHTEGMYTLVVL